MTDFESLEHAVDSITTGKNNPEDMEMFREMFPADESEEAITLDQFLSAANDATERPDILEGAPEVPPTKVWDIQKFEDLEEYLAEAGVGSDEALRMIVEGKEQLTAEQKMDLWNAELKESGVTETEVLDFIKDSLYHNRVSRSYTVAQDLVPGGIVIELQTRTVADQQAIQTKMVEYYGQVGDNTTEDALEMERMKLQIAFSLVSVTSERINISKVDSDFAAVKQFLDTSSSLIFQLLVECISRFNNLVYMSSKRISISNF